MNVELVNSVHGDIKMMYQILYFVKPFYLVKYKEALNIETVISVATFI